MKKKIKFCGFTRITDVEQAVALGVDAIGLVFYPPSPRAVSIEQAIELVKVVPAFTSVVALFVNPTEQQLKQVANGVSFEVIQFHGDESATECAHLANVVNKRWIKALRINNKTDTAESIKKSIEEYINQGASAMLLDAYHHDKYGGTGEIFNWSLIPTLSHCSTNFPIILAGGLTPENIAKVHDISELSMYAVDVSGGIESEKGLKDVHKMKQFITNYKS